MAGKSPPCTCLWGLGSHTWVRGRDCRPFCGQKVKALQAYVHISAAAYGAPRPGLPHQPTARLCLASPSTPARLQASRPPPGAPRAKACLSGPHPRADRAPCLPGRGWRVREARASRENHGAGRSPPSRTLCSGRPLCSAGVGFRHPTSSRPFTWKTREQTGARDAPSPTAPRTRSRPPPDPPAGQPGLLERGGGVGASMPPREAHGPAGASVLKQTSPPAPAPTKAAPSHAVCAVPSSWERLSYPRDALEDARLGGWPTVTQLPPRWSSGQQGRVRASQTGGKGHRRSRLTTPASLLSLKPRTGVKYTRHTMCRRDGFEQLRGAEVHILLPPSPRPSGAAPSPRPLQGSRGVAGSAPLNA